MTERVLTGAEMLQNYFLDQVRFMGADATSGEKGYRVENGEVQVRVRSSDKHYGPTWKLKTLTPTAPVALTVEIVELPPQGTVIIFR